MKVTLLIVVFLVLAFFFIRFFERINLYFPVRTIEATPEDIDLEYEDVSFTAKDGVMLNGWFIPSETHRAVLIFCHGNAGNISHRLEKIKIFNGLDLDVLIFDYRGYGLSKGSPSEKGLYLDAEAAYDYLVNYRGMESVKVVAYGESLGSAVTVDLAGKRRLAGIIIEGGFSSVRDMAKEIFPFIPAFVYKTRFDSLDKIKNIGPPKLIFHSADDEIVPFEHGEKLFHAAAGRRELVRLRGGHNDAFFSSGDIFASKIDSFINRL